MDKERTDQVRAYWREFQRAARLDEDEYDVVAFGDTSALADELAELVVSGDKRATAGLLRDFVEGGESIPRIGGYVVAVDGRGTPRCIWKTTEVTIKPLIAVDDAFAYEEAEGDRTRAGWLDMHRRYFARQAHRDGFHFDDQSETVFERFAVVWPLDAAD